MYFQLIYLRYSNILLLRLDPVIKAIQETQTPAPVVIVIFAVAVATTTAPF